MKLLILLASSIFAYQVEDRTRQQALSLLRSRRKNSGFFEETRNDNFKRECQEELCSIEELREIFPADDQADERKQKWEELTRQCYIRQCNAQGTNLCLQTWNNRECQCHPGWNGDDCGTDIDECAEAKAKGEEDTFCTENARCINNDGSYACECVQGFVLEGDKCEVADPCTLCGDNQVCTDTKQCECKSDGYYAVDDYSCADYDECQEEGKCGDNANCVNNDGGFECTCEEGFSMDSGDCVDIDECADANPCGDNGECNNSDGGYTCNCASGYEEVDGACADIDECAADGTCLADETCHNMVGGHACCASSSTFENGRCIDPDACAGIECGDDQSCANGVCECVNPFDAATPDENGNCVDLDECAVALHTCDADQRCVNREKGFDCISATEAPATDAPTAAPTAAPTEAETDAPTDAPTPQPRGGDQFCDYGFSMQTRHGKEVCVDIDECQSNNGDCPDEAPMCMNFFGSKYCYGELKDETVLCHHEYFVNASSPAGYTCYCYDGYELCHDQFTCVATTREEHFEGDGTSCSDGQVGQNGHCYSPSSGKANLAAAEADCANQGGKLASLNDRRTWWVLGNSIEQGSVSFFIDYDSDMEGCNMHIVGDPVLGGSGNALVANVIGTMHAVPPQWNIVTANEEHHYWCEF